MTELLTHAEFRERYIRFCPTCKQDTMPLSSGICAWCESNLITGEPPDSVEPRPPTHIHGRCDYCEAMLPDGSPSYQRYCSRECRQAYWIKYTRGGQRWLKRHGRKAA